MNKIFIGLIVAISIVGLAFAQSPQPTEFTLKLSSKNIELIGKALGKLPYEDVAQLMQELQIQLNAQVNPKGTTPPNPAPMPTTPPK